MPGGRSEPQAWPLLPAVPDGEGRGADFGNPGCVVDFSSASASAEGGETLPVARE